MVCGQVLGLLLAAQTLGPSWGQSVPTSPCPGIFQYQVDSSGNWHGLITVPAPQPSYAFKITVEMALDAVLRTQYVGAIKLLENENVVWNRINTGDRQPIQFHLYFPLSWPLPTVRSITSNGNVICIGDTPNQVFTKLSLEHILYPISGTTFPQQNHYSNHAFSDLNNFQYFEYTAKNDPFYGKAPPKVAPYEPAHKDYSFEVIHRNTGTSSQATFWPLQTNSTAFSSYATACPNVFQYQQSSSGEWHGVISVPNPYPIVAIDIRVEIYITGTLPLITNGLLKLVNNIYDEWNRIRTGERYYIQYKLDFPLYRPDSSVTPPLPLLKSIIVNNEVICSGSKPSFSAVRTLIYQHSIFNDKCTSSSLDCPYNTEQTRQLNQPTLPVYKPTLPVYKPTPPVYEQIPPVYTQRPPVYEPRPPAYKPTPRVYEQIPPVYEQIPPVYTQRPPVYEPTPPAYKPTTRVYEQVPTEQPLLLPTYIPEPTKQETDSNKGIQCGTLIVRTNPLITYGEDTIHGQWPWHVALYLYRNRDIRYRCGGSFIGTRTIITAAHCVTKNEKRLAPDDIIVYLGRHNLRDLNEEGSQNKDVKLIVVHPSYNSNSTVGDIALLILSSTVEVTTIVRPVCLWDKADNNPADLVDKEGLVAGWGLNEYDDPTETLKMVKMPVVSQQTCIWSDPNYYSQFTSNTTFCAGYRNGSSVCNGDSGGGMVFPEQQSSGTQTWMLRGIVSHSRRRDGYINICDTKSYIVFTDIAQYLDWIYTILI